MTRIISRDGWNYEIYDNGAKIATVHGNGTFAQSIAQVFATAPDMLEALIKCRDILPLQYTAWIDQYIESAMGQSIEEVLK